MIYHGQDASDFNPTQEYDLGGFDVADILDSIVPPENDEETREEIYDYMSDSGIDWTAADDLFGVSVSDVSSEGSFNINFGQPIDPNVPSHFLFDRNKKQSILYVGVQRDGEMLPVDWYVEDISEDGLTIQLEFDDPSEISNSDLYDDELVVHIVEP